MIAFEYAKAIFELASQYNKHEIINDNFSVFLKLLKDNPDYVKVLTFPNISNDSKKDSLKNTLIGFDDLFLDFLYVLVDKRRISIIEEIGQEYARMEREINNVTKVDVYSAQELTKEETKEILSKLEKLIKGQEILINNIVDSSLIGGIKAVYNGKEIDFSLSKKLTDLKKSL